MSELSINKTEGDFAKDASIQRAQSLRLIWAQSPAIECRSIETSLILDSQPAGVWKNLSVSARDSILDVDGAQVDMRVVISVWIASANDHDFATSHMPLTIVFAR